MEQDRRDLFQYLLEYDQNSFNKMPSGVWSVNQNIQHLIKSEKGTLQYMSKKILAGDDLIDTNFKNKCNWFMLKWAFRTPFKFKVPQIVDPKSETFNFHELMHEWEQARHELQVFINEFPQKYRNKNIFKHPYAGRSNLKMAIDFLDFHSARHFKQIKRTIKSLP